MTSKELKIEGMSCGHCVMAVKKELNKLTDVIINDVQIGSEKTIMESIEAAGYKVVN